eukprot:1188061-Prymnesium_polylepis.1
MHFRSLSPETRVTFAYYPPVNPTERHKQVQRQSAKPKGGAALGRCVAFVWLLRLCGCADSSRLRLALAV